MSEFLSYSLMPGFNSIMMSSDRNKQSLPYSNKRVQFSMWIRSLNPISIDRIYGISEHGDGVILRSLWLLTGRVHGSLFGQLYNSQRDTFILYYIIPLYMHRLIWLIAYLSTAFSCYFLICFFSNFIYSFPFSCFVATGSSCAVQLGQRLSRQRQTMGSPSWSVWSGRVSNRGSRSTTQGIRLLQVSL